ncbi:MAG TPA: glycosyltransferase family 4 protein [Chloroflexota bacterium]|nr:glycosyltransferase family 4 protein [Chloroflexota bacterium]
MIEREGVRPLKILMFMGYYLPYVSGMTIYAQRLAEGLVKRGHQVTILCSHHQKDTPLEEWMNGVRVVRSRVLFRAGKGVVMPLYWYDLRRLLREHDIFHRHVPGLLDAYVSTRIAKSMGKPILMTHHCDIFLPLGVVNDVLETAMHADLRYAGALADKIISYSQDYVAYSRFLSLYRRKVETVYPPIMIGQPDEEIARAWRQKLGLEGKKIVGYSGRFSADKGGDVLLRAIPLLRERIPDAHVVFAGEFKQVLGETFYEECLPLVEQQRGHVTFLGNVPMQDMPHFYRMCDVCCVPSTNSTESWGMWQTESMLCGTPAVTTDLPGVRESIRVTGMGKIVRPHDEVGLAQALATVLQNPERYRQAKRDPHEIFRPELTIDAYERWYRELGG